ncbi:MAG TPA: dihydroxy-acid dehydratase [Acidimicrobiales bacterium]|nr:dihydroxy-acid dehydratase [Acidimicrobiales bacterium]
MTGAERSGSPALPGIDGGPTEYGDPGFSRFLRRAFLASAGYDAADLDRPVVGIADTSSGYTTCHRQMPELVEAVSRGVLEAGGLPVRFPTMSLPEILLSPTSMLFRNLLAMETEEQIRSQPMDAVVLCGGCDKTVPAQLMAAVSADVPAVQLVTGPMSTGSWRGERLGACTDCRRMWALHRAGELDGEEIAEVGANLCPTAGTCMVMGTASTMACVTEALGMMVGGGATPPAASGRRLQVGVESGRLAVQAARARRRPSSVLDARSFDNALTSLVALGGSTNAVIHLTAIARRAGIALGLADLERIGSVTPLIVDCKPSGSGYLEDLERAGGMPAVLRQLARAGLLELEARTVSGASLGELLEGSSPSSGAAAARTTGAGGAPVVRTVADPLGPPGSIRALRGTLAPDGAVIKCSAASRELWRHTGPALVFDSPEEAARRLDDADLELDPTTVLVLRNAGPVGAGMPEAGSLPLPRRLLAAGVRDMVRVSDARMSGTAYGTVVLHVSPEAAVGGPLALVVDGDLVALDVEAGTIDLLVDKDELDRRREAWQPPPLPERGWRRLHAETVLPAHLGADLAFLGPPGSRT